MKSRKILSLILAALMVATMVPMSFAADDAGKAEEPASTTAPAETTDDAEAPEEGEAAPAEDAAPAEGDAAPADDAAPAEGDAAPAEGDAAPAEGDAAPAEGDDTQVTVPVVVKKDATLSANAVLVNGEKVAFDAYTIDGFNYFKLRDIAAALAGSDAAFNVAWNEEAFCIELTTGAAYTKLDTDLVAGKGEASVIASSTKMGILLNGEAVELSGYSISGNTYFQLRDLGEKLGFEVSWNAEAKSIGIDAKKADDAEAPAEGDAAPAEGDAAPAEGDAAPAKGDAAPAEGDAAPAEGDAAPAEGDAAPAEGDEAPAAE